jgi:ABC-2 type transport system ATP-binding protein
VNKGEVYGFVGPNGAGKSTIMKMLLNLVQPDSGEVYVFGQKMNDKSYECLKRIGSIIENPYFYEKMTARQNLELHCEYMGYHNKERIDEVLQLVNLQNVEGKSIVHYSLGMKQRLAIARAILAKPELLILDEPINALDPEGIKEMRSLFLRLHQYFDTTIFISSHILSEVEQIADRIGVISGGRLLKEVSMNDVHEYQAEYIEMNVDDVKGAACLLEQNKKYSHFTVMNDNTIRIYDANVSGKEISALLVKNGVGLESIGRKENSLEDYFFQLTEGEK